MTGTVSPQVPILNSPDSTEEPKVRSAIITIRDALNAVLTSSNILDGAKLAAGTVATAALANLSVTAAKIGLGEVNALHLANDSVTTNAIEDLNVTGAKIANGTIGAGKLALTSLSDVLATSDVGIPATWTDYLSVTPVANATYIVLAQIAIAPSTLTNAINANARLLVDGAASITMDEIFTDSLVVVPIMSVVTPTTTSPIKVQAQREGALGIQVYANSLTRMRAVRIG